MNPNAKGDLIAALLSRGLGAPSFEVQSWGPAHEQTFAVSVMVGERLLGQGQGRTKKEAERGAAENALRQLEEGADASAAAPAPTAAWPIYSAVLAEALSVALALATENATPAQVGREAAQLYRDLLGELGHQPE